MIGMTPTLREYLRVEDIGSDPKVHAAVVLIMSLRGSALLGPTQEPSVTALDQHLTPSDLIVLDDMTQEEESARDCRTLGAALLATHKRLPGTDLYLRKPTSERAESALEGSCRHATYYVDGFSRHCAVCGEYLGSTL